MGKIVITGATGLVGQALVPPLMKRGYDIIAVSRNPYNVHAALSPDVKAVSWEPFGDETLVSHVDGADAVINLAGENVGHGRWTPQRKLKIINSRVDATRRIVEAIGMAEKRPKVLLQASAIGFYGVDRRIIATESSPRGEGFLSEVSYAWEQEALPIDSTETRLIRMRIGVVLAKNGGAFPRLKLPFMFFLGGHPGSGKQWLSWIHISDLVYAMIFLLENDNAEGVYNMTAPHPIRMSEFSSVLGRQMKRPSLFKVPSTAMRLAMGEMADEMVLNGARVNSNRLPEAGYRFRYPTIIEAVDDLLNR